MHIALDFESCFLGGSRPDIQFAQATPLLDICRICNIADPQLVKRYLQEHSSLFYTKLRYDPNKGKHVLTYYAAYHLCKFFFAGQSQHLYSASWIIGNCWETLECALRMRLKRDYLAKSMKLTSNLNKFFTPQQGCQLSSASLMLSADTIKNGSDSNRLLHFLKFLSRIPWLDILFDCKTGRMPSQAISHWVCEALVS